MEALLVEALQQQLEPFLEDFAVGFGIEQWPAEALDLARVVAAPDPHDDAAVGHDVGHRIVFREPHRVPHRQDVETAAEFELLRLRREPQPPLDQIGDALIAFVLEMVLGGPEAVIAQFVHDPGDPARGLEHLGEPLVRIAPVVGRGAVEPDIVKLDLSDIERMKPLDHCCRDLHPSGYVNAVRNI